MVILSQIAFDSGNFIADTICWLVITYADVQTVAVLPKLVLKWQGYLLSVALVR